MTTSSRCNRFATRIFCVMVLTLGMLPCTLFAEGTAEIRTNWATKAFKKNCEAVVCIQGDKIDDFGDASRNAGRESGKSYNGMGTGIIIDERGYIVTNFHVVEGIRKIQVTTFDNNQYTGTLLGTRIRTWRSSKSMPENRSRPSRWGDLTI